VLKDYYQKQGKLCCVDGQQSIEDVNQDILRALGVQV
jgi:adenylate kinase family enzyme